MKWMWLLIAVAACGNAGPVMSGAPAPPAMADCPKTPVAVALLKDRRDGNFVLAAPGTDARAYVSMNGVWRVPVAGGALEPLATVASATIGTGPLVRAGDRLYFVENSFRDPTTRVRSVPVTGGAAETLGGDIVPPPAGLQAGFRVGGLVITNEHVLLLLTGRGHHLLWLARADGSVAAALTQDGLAGFGQLIGDEAGAYVTTANGIARVERTGVSVETAASTRVEGLALDATHVYWRESRDFALPRILRAPRLTLAPVEALAETAEKDGFALTLDATHVYWSDQSGEVHRVAKAGGPAVLIATAGRYDDDDYDGAIAVDADNVYWYSAPPGAFANDDNPISLMRACKAPL